MLSKSKQVKLIDASDNTGAQELLEQSRELRELAKLALNENDIDGADTAINDAMKALDSARSAFRQRPNATLVERARYKELQDSIKTFRASLSKEAQANLDSDKLDALLADARTEMKKDNFIAANGHLNKAYQLIIAVVNGSYKESTLVYSLDFETPEQEYEYEVKRFEGNKSLVDKLLAQKGESKKTALVRRYVEKAMQTQEQAKHQAGQGDFKQAISTMEKTSNQLRRAMGMLGINF